MLLPQRRTPNKTVAEAAPRDTPNRRSLSIKGAGNRCPAGSSSTCRSVSRNSTKLCYLKHSSRQPPPLEPDRVSRAGAMRTKQRPQRCGTREDSSVAVSTSRRCAKSDRSPERVPRLPRAVGEGFTPQSAPLFSLTNPRHAESPSPFSLCLRRRLWAVHLPVVNPSNCRFRRRAIVGSVAHHGAASSSSTRSPPR